MADHEDNSQFALTSFLYGGNADYIDRIYAAYEEDPSSVDADWRDFFASLQDNKEDVLKNAKGASWARKNWPIKTENDLIAAMDGNWPEAGKKEAKPNQLKKAVNSNAKPQQDTKVLQAEQPKPAQSALTAADLQKAAQASVKAHALIEAYKTYGHLHANIDPLEQSAKPDDYNLLAPQYYGFSEADYDQEIFLNGALGLQYGSLRQVLTILKQRYLGTVGAEFMHITDPLRRKWVEENFLDKQQQSVDETGQKALLHKLIAAEGFEKFLDNKYKGTKRFGLDGGETLIPALQALIEQSVKQGVQEIILGMAHRGRLNVLTQVLDKAHAAVFHEFKGGSYKPDDVPGSGDVKYHLGHSNDKDINGQMVHLSLLPNPSHLEIVDPIVLGKTRGRQKLYDQQAAKATAADLAHNHDTARANSHDKVMPVLIHGDAAFAGQGVVAETFNLSALKGYNVGGSIHIIINNQIGFTTNPENARSTTYCSDLAKMIEAPVFHVNGDDPEAMVKIMQLAAQYRQKFHQPIIIDMLCYRRFGHNEGDEPAFTQPLMYQKIRAHRGVVAIYGQKLIAENRISKAELQKAEQDWREKMEAAFATQFCSNKANWLEGQWANIKPAGRIEEQNLKKTGVERQSLVDIGTKLTSLPKDLHLHKTVQRFVDHRTKILAQGEGIDWATAEALAFGSLLKEGHPIRLSGEDVERGTFSHRHSVFYDQQSQQPYTPLNHLDEKQAHYEAVNSLLSEEAVLGYEYGYSLVDPQSLTLWEAQFGDFANGAQTVFDQFISASEQKWLRLSGLVCLLPHGFEGQGPEHSSARLERFLQLCAEENMQVANCTTPANYFHILRRQIKRNFRKPLILMAPKSLLRHKKAVSSLDEMLEGTAFHTVLTDDAERLANTDLKLQADDKIRRVILCSGKVYYDLAEAREKQAKDDIYIVRLEQLYPFPAQALADLLQRFRQAEIIWCQEEPKNMGAWSFIAPYVEWVLQHIGADTIRPQYIGRPAAASPAAGLVDDHKAQLTNFIDKALVLKTNEH